MTLSFLSTELELSVDDVESLLVDMIMDERISAHIDQMSGIVTLDKVGRSVKDTFYKRIGDWAEVLEKSTQQLTHRE